MNTQHTPGPWTVFEKPTLADGPNFLVLDEVGNLIVDCGHDEDRALLIASAPDLLKDRDELKEKWEQCDIEWHRECGQLKALNAELLEALKEIKRVAGDELTQGHAHAYQKLLKAIAKAEGK